MSLEERITGGKATFVNKWEFDEENRILHFVFTHYTEGQESVAGELTFWKVEDYCVEAWDEEELRELLAGISSSDFIGITEPDPKRDNRYYMATSAAEVSFVSGVPPVWTRPDNPLKKGGDG